jgi:hypothetical protein
VNFWQEWKETHITRTKYIADEKRDYDTPRVISPHVFLKISREIFR